MEELTIQVKGPSSKPYELIFIRDGDSLTAICDCPAGTFNNLCKHRVSILDGDYSAVSEEDQSKAKTVTAWLAGTDVETALVELRRVEADAGSTKADLAAAKRKVARAMNT